MRERSDNAGFRLRIRMLLVVIVVVVVVVIKPQGCSQLQGIFGE
jgi:hypothetical protein